MTMPSEVAALFTALARSYSAQWASLPSETAYQEFRRIEERLDAVHATEAVERLDTQNVRRCVSSMRNVLEFVRAFPGGSVDGLLLELWGAEFRPTVVTWIARHPSPIENRPPGLLTSNHPEVAALARAALPRLVREAVSWGQRRKWFPEDVIPPPVELARMPSRFIPAENKVYLDSDLFYGVAEHGEVRLRLDLAAASLFHELAGHWVQHALPSKRGLGAFMDSDSALLPALIPVEEGFALLRERAARDFLEAAGRPFHPEMWAVRSSTLASQALFAYLQWAEAPDPAFNASRFLAEHLPAGYAFAYTNIRRVSFKEMLYKTGSFIGLLMMEALGDHPFAGFWAATLYAQAIRGGPDAS